MKNVRFYWHASIGVLSLSSLVACNTSTYKADRSFTSSKEEALNQQAFKNSANSLAPPSETIPGGGDGSNGSGGPGGAGGSGGSSGNPGGAGGSGTSGNGSSGDSGERGNVPSGAFGTQLLCSNNVSQKTGTYLVKAQGISVKAYQGTSSVVLFENLDLATAYNLKSSVLNGTANLSLQLKDGSYHIVFCDVGMHSSCQADSNFLTRAGSATSDAILNYATTGMLGVAPNTVISGGKITSGKAYVLRDKNDSSGGVQGGCDEVRSPLVVDVSGAGIELSSPAEGVEFDISGSGVKHRISWPLQATTAFLALDRDGNGNIDSVHELFGDRTIGPDGQPAANGFEALRKYDANGDGWIDEKDAIYAKLVLWFDRDRDGRVSEGELQSLSEAKLLGIDLSYKSGFEQDIYGNQTRERSVAEFADGVLRTIFDIWFKI